MATRDRASDRPMLPWSRRVRDGVSPTAPRGRSWSDSERLCAEMLTESRVTLIYTVLPVNPRRD